MLWQKLQREMPATLAKTIKIADSYALGDPMQPTLDSQGQGQTQRNNNNAGGSGQFYRPDNQNKRRDGRPDYRYGSAQVAAMEEEQGGAGSSQCPRYEGYQQPQQQQQLPQQQAQPFQKKNVWINKNAGGGAGQKKQWPKYIVGLAMDKPCVFHTFQLGKPANHLTRNCSWLDNILASRAGPWEPARPLIPAAPSPLTGANIVAVPPRPVNPGNQSNAGSANVNQVDQSYNLEYYASGPVACRNEYKEHDQSYMVFETKRTDKQSLYRRSLEVNAVMLAVLKLMYWSDQAIGWDRADHPKIMPNPGGYALVTDPTFVGPASNVRFSKVLIDNRSSINIMYRDTMHKLGIKENMLEPSKTIFHGIVPGLSCAPMGKIQMDVIFGNQDNCRVENLMFEVVDLDSPYHALLGRPTLVKFMASTYVAYLKMKMLGPRGVITIVGDYKRSMACATAGSNLAETLIIVEEKKRLKQAVEIAETVVAGTPLPGMTNPSGSSSFQVAKEVKKVPLDEVFPERHALIDAGLDPK
jgi:hypothetical protein